MACCDERTYSADMAVFGVAQVIRCAAGHFLGALVDHCNRGVVRLCSGLWRGFGILFLPVKHDRLRLGFGDVVVKWVDVLYAIHADPQVMA